METRDHSRGPSVSDACFAEVVGGDGRESKNGVDLYEEWQSESSEKREQTEQNRTRRFVTRGIVAE